jgi:hypothetical protein
MPEASKSRLILSIRQNSSLWMFYEEIRTGKDFLRCQRHPSPISMVTSMVSGCLGLSTPEALKKLS